MLSKSRVKYIQSLYHKKFRDQDGLFVIEGPKIVKEFLELAPDLIESIYVQQEWVDLHGSLLQQLPPQLVSIVKDYELEKASALSTPNMALAVVKKKPPYTNAGGNGFYLMLDDIQDPGNLGTIIRTADWFGVKEIICSIACVDMYNPKVIQSTMGSILRVNVIYENLSDWYKKNNQLPLYAATLGGKPLQELKVKNPGILLIGNESKGVSETMLALSSEEIRIPGSGGAESLNAAVATGIILWHCCKPQ